MAANPLIRILTLHCDEASRIASDALDGPIGRADRAALTIHRCLCGPCRRFGRQIAEVRDLAGRAEGEGVDPPGPGLPDDARERIRRSLGG